MGETTLYISKIIGPLFLVLGLAFLVSQKHYADLFRILYKRPGVLFLAALIELTVGLVLVINHNVWDSFAAVVVSIMGWGGILEGALILIWTKPYMRMALRLISPPLIMFGSILGLLVGAYLTYFAYLA